MAQLKIKSCLLLLLVASISAFGQRHMRYTDFGASAGIILHNGEVSTGEISGYLADVRPQFSTHLKRTYGSWFVLGSELTYGFLSSKDENHTNPRRGYIVNTHTLQVNAFIEMNLIKFGKNLREKPWTPYIKLGYGALFYNPILAENQIYPKEIELRPNAYWTTHFFSGGGFKIRTSYRTYISLEATISFLGVDDIEGWQYSPNRTNNDVIGGGRIGLSYMIF